MKTPPEKKLKTIGNIMFVLELLVCFTIGALNPSDFNILIFWIACPPLAYIQLVLLRTFAELAENVRAISGSLNPDHAEIEAAEEQPAPSMEDTADEKKEAEERAALLEKRKAVAEKLADRDKLTQEQIDTLTNLMDKINAALGESGEE